MKIIEWVKKYPFSIITIFFVGLLFSGLLSCCIQKIGLPITMIALGVTGLIVTLMIALERK